MDDPRACTTMADLRALIDRVDGDLVALLVRRQACIDRATEIKRAEGLPARIPARVEDVLAKVRARAEADGLDPGLAEDLWRTLIEWSIAREVRGLGESP